uniref:Ribonuclease H-like domain-containing protein n=1 Tax=Tanacetum cinerariifolium TaxID=118510 RepID=A0A6L2J3J7_TANCI|nr:ribonuclease H-like domain-containing protein [Tanacetum cinerariifolium]
MTGSDKTLLPAPPSEKLSLVTHHHLLTRVPVKLDLDNWNFGSWEFFFEELCASYEVDKYHRSPINETSASSLAPLTPEEIKVDKIMLSLILFTLSDSLRARIVVARPMSAKEVWNLISDIVKDNKRSRTNTLKAELLSIKLGDQSMESYFQKIDSIFNTLTSLDARVNEEDVVHYALERLPDTYNQVCGYMHWKDSFFDLKAVRSLLIAEEIRLKSNVLALLVDSSSPMVLWRKQALIHVLPRLKVSVGSLVSILLRGRGTSENTTNDLLTKLLAQLGHLGMNVAMPNNGTNVTLPTHATVTPTVTGPNIASNVPTTPHAFYASPGTFSGLNSTPPPGPVDTTMGSVSSSGAVNTSGQATLLPQAFNAKTLHDPTTSAWNMDTGVSSHLNNFVTSLSTILNSCMYSTVSVGDGHSIPFTNTGHRILSTPLKSLRLNNVLITPHIVKNLIYVRQFVRDNDYTIEFDSFGISVKDFMTRRVLLQCGSTEDLYPVTAPSSIPSAFLVSEQTWHQRLGHPGSEVFRRLVSNNVISCNKEKPPVLCHALANTCGFHLSVLHSDFVWVFLLIHKYDVLSKFVLFRNYVHTQFKYEIRSFQCDHGGEFGNRKLHDLFNTNGIQFCFSCPKTSQQNGKSERMKYVVEILEKAHMLNCNPGRTPIDTESKLGVGGDPVSDSTLYRSLAGYLEYLTFTRPDISYAVQQLISSSTTDLVVYFDADGAGCPNTRRSTSGYCVFLGNNLLSWSSKSQPTLSRSSAEAEYCGVANVVAETCWLLHELHTPLSFATLVYCDNVSVVYSSCNLVQHQCTKHIEIDIHFVRNLVAVGQARFLHVPSRYQFADIFTKGLPSALFKEFRTSLSIRCPPALTVGEC